MSDLLSEKNKIEISIQSQYLPKHKAKDGQYAFAYQVLIKNTGLEYVQLMHRYWLVTTADGKKVEVSGEGVVGKQPVIEAGDSFSYTSGALLESPVGTMEGYYEMQDAQGKMFKALIEPFVLATPNMIN